MTYRQLLRQSSLRPLDRDELRALNVFREDETLRRYRAIRAYRQATSIKGVWTAIKEIFSGK
jgi:hypothetical protein